MLFSAHKWSLHCIVKTGFCHQMYVSCIHKIFVRNRLELAFINTTEIVLQLYLFPLLIEAACFVIKSAIIIFLSLLGVSKTPSRGRGRGRGSGSGCLLFFPIFFFAIYLQIDSFWSKKYLLVYNGKSF